MRYVLIIMLAALSLAAENPKLIHAGEDRVPGEYLVVLEDELPEPIPAVVAKLAAAHDVRVEMIWTHALKGFFARMTDAQALKLSRHPFVRYVEENAPWYFSGEHATYVDPASCDPLSGSCPSVVDNRLWHLDRADQNSPLPTNRYAYNTDGSGVTVYVVDTGVNKWHHEFGGTRVMAGFNSSGDNMPADDPCLGFAIPPGVFTKEMEHYLQEIFYASHGTGVASMVGGKRVGVAKNVTIVPVKVARCSRYAARDRKASTQYAQWETMIRLSSDGTLLGYYQAQNAGTTAAGAGPAIWPAVDGTVMDATVLWKRLDYDAEIAQTTQMLVSGLNWILSPDNPYSTSPAIVTLSMFRQIHPLNDYDQVVGAGQTIEGIIRQLLTAGITVIASANNQNGNACNTTPARMSSGNTDPAVRADVITVGGSMLRNRPWSVNVADVSPEGYYAAHGGAKGEEPSYVATVGVRDARWICDKGDSSTACNNATPTASADPTGAPRVYQNYQGGSNAGPCVTLFAPAKNLPVAGLKSASSYRDPRVAGRSGNLQDGGHASGTSWSAPIVAGFAARVLQTNPSLTPVQVRDVLLTNTDAVLEESTLNPYDHLGNLITGTPNKLLRLSDVNIFAHPQTTAAAGSGPTTLSVTASGTASVAYQWYRVNDGFDFMAYQRGAHSSTLLAGETASTYHAPAAAVSQAYWVRVSNQWGSADSTIAVVVPGLTPPTNLVATRTGSNVTLTWTPGSGASAQEVQWKKAGQAWQTIATVTNTTTTYAHTPTGPMVVYRVRAIKAPAAASSNRDVVNLNTYEPLTIIRAQHIIDLRQAANDLCAAIDIAPVFGITEVSLSSLQGGTVRASDITTLMERINTIRTHSSLGLAPASFGTPPASGGAVVGGQVLSTRSALQ
ncbi:MAG TPA: S8 family serine peptidase [Thermoanaerobaculia bacterium]|nr:S8 family serine peptidase [Thermoanaerobaculia bacterium]